MRHYRAKRQPASAPIQSSGSRFTPSPVIQPKAEATKLPKWEQASSYDLDILNVNSAPIQAKLTIGEPNDKYEQEADQVAAEVVQRMDEPESVQRESLPEEEELQMKPEAIQRELPEEEELQMKPQLQRQGVSGAVSPELEQSLNRAKSGGQALDPQIQAKMGQAMGADFSSVKVHTDSQADQLNQSIQAKAFTTGQDVFFRQGEYNPGSSSGQELIAHELTHVVQQTGNTTEVQRKLGQNSSALYIQRMPTAQELLTVYKPKKNNILGKQSTKYKDVIGALQNYENYIRETLVARGDKETLRIQMVTVDQLLENVYAAMSKYDNKKQKGKAAVMQQRKGEVRQEQSIVAQAFLAELDKPEVAPRQNPNQLNRRGGMRLLTPIHLSDIIDRKRQSAGPVQLDETEKVGSASGGSKTVGLYNMDNNGKQGFFKEDVDTLDPLAQDDREFSKWFSQLKIDITEEGTEKGWSQEKILEEIQKKKTAKENEYWVGIDLAGINQDDARLASRDVAMSRLDQLLGSKMIARAQFAVVTMGDGTQVKGSIMDAANKPNAKSPKQDLDDPQLTTKTQKRAAVGSEDADYLRLMSRLHLIDLIAHQVDRNVGNYFIERDGNGQIIGVTGIDNDMSFGQKDLPTKRNRQELQPVSKFVDREMAEVILSITPEMLLAILRDLLEPADINAAIYRLQTLQENLKSATLLNPDEWNAQINAIKQEGRHYEAAIENVIKFDPD